MKIFIGLTEIAGITSHYARGFQKLGHETITVLMQPNKYYLDVKYDHILSSSYTDDSSVLSQAWDVLQRKARAAWLFPRLLSECDVFVYIWGTAFLPGARDYALIKRAGKKLVSTFWGSDIRYEDAVRQEMQKLGVAREIEPFLAHLNTARYYSTYQNKKRVVEAAERHADLILSQPGYGQLQTRPYMRANVPIDPRLFHFHIPDRDIPLVLHVPSNRGIKGTEYVLDAVERLKKEGIRFEFRLVENMPNTQVRELLGEADIVVDELFSETIGVLSTEAMASGVVTLVRYMPEYAAIPAGCPAVNVTMDTLVERLRTVILDRDWRRALAQAGRPYVEAHFDYVKVARELLRWLEPGEIQQYDFIPDFYKGYIPPGSIKE
jgi:glycosyltransferase involved in cell wall biosynthesis